jgi:hypothetical protein
MEKNLEKNLECLSKVVTINTFIITLFKLNKKFFNQNLNAIKRREPNVKPETNIPSELSAK